MKIHKIINYLSHLVYGQEKKAREEKKRTSQSCLIVAIQLAPNAYKEAKPKLKRNINRKTRTRAIAVAENMYAYSIYN